MSVMRKWLWLAMCMAGMIGAGGAWALTMIPLEIHELVDQAQLVIQGRVNSRSCQRDDTGRIYTQVELQVTAVWKGNAPSPVVTVVHGGGVLGEHRTIVPGQVEYEIGEEVVAFLVLNRRGEAVTLGLAQGKFRVSNDPRTGERLVTNPFHGAEPGAASVARSGAASGRRLALNDLKRRVEERTR